MNDNVKRVALVVVIVASIVVAGFGAKRALSGDQMEVEKVIAAPPGHKSEKQLAIEHQNVGTSAADDGGERDLGG